MWWVIIWYVEMVIGWIFLCFFENLLILFLVSEVCVISFCFYCWVVMILVIRINVVVLVLVIVVVLISVLLVLYGSIIILELFV